MRLFILFTLGAALLLSLSGCATILSGSSETIHFTSSPSGAEVYANGNYICTTPCSADLKKNDEYSVELVLEGYPKTGRTRLTTSTGGGWIIADVLFSGLIGIVVDAATGSWNSFDQNSVHTKFSK